MPTWDPDLYLRFGGERIQPCVDLARRARDVTVSPRRVADLGCGPGNSTAILREQFDEALLLGVDSSPDMLAQAWESGLDADWQQADIGAWQPGECFDLIFSNAALQWVPDHASLFPRLLGLLNPGGVLAVQMPYHVASPVHQSIFATAREPRFAAHFDGFSDGLKIHEPGDYYRWLAPRASVQLWQTDYIHVLDGPDAIVHWIAGSGLRPYIEHLPDDATRSAFRDAYAARIREAYRPEPDGMVLFPFRRLLMVARVG